MRGSFYIGWILMLGAFASAAAETGARAIPGGSGWLMSAADLWRALFPGSFFLTELRLREIAPTLWDPVLLGLLALPAWAILGIPGLILAWTCRPGRKMSPAAEEELRQHEASLFLYDELAREARKWARETGDNPNEDDRLPSHEQQDLLDRDPDDDEDDFEDLIDPLPDFVRRKDP